MGTYKAPAGVSPPICKPAQAHFGAMAPGPASCLHWLFIGFAPRLKWDSMKRSGRAVVHTHLVLDGKRVSYSIDLNVKSSVPVVFYGRLPPSSGPLDGAKPPKRRGYSKPAK